MPATTSSSAKATKIPKGMLPFNGRALKDIRLERGLNQADLAGRVGISCLQLRKIETSGMVAAPLVERLVEVLDCETDDLEIDYHAAERASEAAAARRSRVLVLVGHVLEATDEQIACLETLFGLKRKEAISERRGVPARSREAP